MKIFGFNLKDNIFRNIETELLNNLHFGYSSRNNTDWGNGVLLYIDDMSKENEDVTPETNLSSIEDEEYFISFFDKGIEHLFKIIKTGEFDDNENIGQWTSRWIFFDKISKDSAYFTSKGITVETTSISFETLLSEQNISNIEKEFKLYKIYDNGLDITLENITELINNNINEILNIENNIYSAPTECKLVSTGNVVIDVDDFDKLKFVTNIEDGSYSKCYDLGSTTINKILTRELNLSNVVFDLVNQDDIQIITGLKYKSMIQISKIDYALIFEYATQTGAKNVTITTEKFADNNGQTQLGVFMDSNLNLVNTNEGKIPPIDINLLNNNIFVDSLLFGWVDNPIATEELFFNYLLCKNFILHNKINYNGIRYITERQIPEWDETIINDKMYYTKEVYLGQISAKNYNVKNYLIEIDMENDFKGSQNNKFDLFKDIGGFKILKDNSTGYYLNGNTFRLREIAIFYNNTTDDVLVPIYYARANININSTTGYNFKIII